MSYANNKDADHPAHPRSLISACVVRCLDSIILLVSTSEIPGLYLASVAAQAGLCLTWSQTPKAGFLVTRLIYISFESIRRDIFPTRLEMTEILLKGRKTLTHPSIHPYFQNNT